jgi:hypothetical protein
MKRAEPTCDDYLDGAERAMAASDWPAAAEFVDAALQMLRSRCPPPYPARFMKLCEAVAPHHSIVAFNLAGIKLTGKFGGASFKQAVETLRRLSHGDDIHIAGMAHGVLGNIADGDYGGKPDPAKALSHFEQAARLGAPGGTYNAAMAYRYGIATAPDRATALRLFRQAYDASPGADPGVCIHLATTIAMADTAAAELEACGILDMSCEKTPEISLMLDVLHGADDRWPSAAAFAADFERRTLHRIEIDKVVARCSIFDRMLRIRNVPARRMTCFIETFMGWKLDGTDPFAYRFGDRIADATTSDGRRIPIFAVGGQLGDEDDPMIKRIKAALAKTCRDAVLISPFLCLAGHDDALGRRMLGYGLLLKGGRWSSFALAPGGFDKVVAEAGDLDRDWSAYLARNGVVGLDPDLGLWMTRGGSLSDLKKMMSTSGFGRRRKAA